MKKTRSELKREAILLAAKEAFREFGAQSTSMDKIAALAQVSKRTVYNHFSSKEVLIMTLLADLWSATANLVDSDQLMSLPMEEQLEQLLYSEIEILSSNEYIDLARVVLGYYLYRPDELIEQSELMAKKEGQILSWLKHQISLKNLDIQDVDLANGQLHSLVKGGCFWPQVMGVKSSLSDQEKRYLAQQTTLFFISYYGCKK
ncbi:TetR/AcrR family transcriptional regulator [Vibrio diazotrophicus]|uniref:TetR/AcrR family transcriptional regulator n=1 Tax=Vibrio diazotrophicus TaxID=685 RepID=A0A2J8I5Y4_VIBDI|nr:TetR/AcrR family transcriptional regulator [Vibrio diazotrophicus]PNI05901.1 TetR/AcrR family transcriptional regulator [Vibrio diazotrophicus]